MKRLEVELQVRRILRSVPLGLLLLLLLLPAPAASGYSVLTHEAIIDSTWDSAIRPMLLKRFPAATADELTRAHAFAYGGCIIQDFGYYNLAVPMFYPKLGLKYGKRVTYADNPVAHGKTEFAFDVFQAARGRYASAAYKDFVGFEVAKPLRSARYSQRELLSEQPPR